MELKCRDSSGNKLLQAEKDSLGIHNSVTHESLFTCKLLGKAVHKLEGVL